MRFDPSARRTFPWSWSFFSVLFVCIAVLVATTANAETKIFRLDNGMELIVVEDHRAPSVVHMVWYDVGAIDEPAGKTGVAHVFEHMMFKGTPSVGPGEFSRRVAELGGRDNAFTSRDYTAYFQQIPPEALGEVMALEADRMEHLVFDPDEFVKEREVVREERRLRTDDVPEALGHEALMATVFWSHPYRNPIIGWPTDLERLRLEDVQQWYRSWYAPNNARLVVVGDVNAGEVYALAQRHYGAIGARPVPERPFLDETPQHGRRHAVVQGPTELSSMRLAWKVPPLRDLEADRDPYALMVLAAVLDGYDGARLTKALVREQPRAIAVSADYDGIARGPGLFTLSASARPGIALDQLEKALREEVERIAKEGVSEQELQRVIRQAVAQQVYKRDSLMGQAMEIGFARAVGLPWDASARITEAIQRVTAEDVQRVAQTWFTEEGLTRVDVLPDGRAPRPVATDPHAPLR
ncbi:M16 family metallopeptidase [Tepidiphilus baoligensis]|uniref:Insulinase family protein n=1 Tax=Tepidiphilus baoligensis TaxID=2698687 RepID=A0ABX1QK11_9PROT|nr:pitrilysin family protein [Tepidiphilus baoligensis]NMH16032.1 insulinase family protein [Tepidiphilus baoligensis]